MTELDEVHSPDVTPERLVELAASADTEVREAVANHPEAPEQAFTTLAGDAEVKELADDDDEWVRLGVAEHRSTPGDAIATLAADKVARVKAAAIASPNLPEHVKAMIALSQ